MLGKADATRAWSAALVLVLPVLLTLTSSAAAPEPATLLVTYREGARGADVAERARAPLASDLPGISLLLVPDAPGVAAALARDPDVLAVERDGTARLAAATWNSATWNGATWNGATWNGATWNGATWNGATWNGATWNGATWNGATWNGATWNGATWNGATWNGAESGGLAPPWGAYAIRAPEAWRMATRHDERLVCMVDSGVDATHPALAGALRLDAHGRAGVDLLNPGAAPHDEAGHGTHLAGIVAAAADSLVPGVAPHARISVAKAFDAAGHAQTSDLVAGLAHCADIDADVVLLAFTEDAPTRAFRESVARLQRGGALVVAATGNDGCERCVGEPAALPGVLGVAAFAPDGARAPFNSEGAQVDLRAPGVFITSAYPGDAWRTGSGTSQAAAFAAGAAALAWSEKPKLDAHGVSSLLTRNADKDGRLDLAAALSDARGARR